MVNRMDTITIICKKKNREVLTRDEIAYMVNGYVDGSIPDYQMSSFLMAICMAGMNSQEILDLTDVMIKSGEQLDLSFLGDAVVDKHSTGGVGDKTTLILAPLVASLGLTVAKMSGRGLGLTGGTIDKLESIQGFETSLSNEEFLKELQDIHLAVVSGNANLVPADKKIYALRDVTGTVESIPLIASSIMSKKIAAGTKKVVIDLKVGNGALMKTEEDAKRLAETMIAIGKAYHVKVVCVLSRMDEPLGYAIGNGLEVKETVEALQGNYAPDVLELIQVLASYMVSLGLEISYSEAFLKVESALREKTGYSYFEAMVKRQKGDINRVALSKQMIEIKSKKRGFIHHIDAYRLAEISQDLGSGRKELTDTIDHGVGLWLHKKSGDYVEVGDTLLTMYVGTKEVDCEKVLDAYQIMEEPFTRKSIIIDVVM